MATVAGIEIGLPRSIDDVTTDWLTAALRTSGAIDPETSVATATNKRFAEGVGLLSELHRSTLTYDGDATEAPETVIVKFAIADPAQRGLAEALGFYTKELTFYRELADEMPIRVPKAHAAMQDPESGDFVLVMEDLSGLRTADQVIGVTWPDALRSARAMAKLHAQFHDDPRLADWAEVYAPIENPIYLAALPGVFATGWAAALAHSADIIPTDVKEFGDRFGEHIPFLLNSFMGPMTLLHGDWRGDNLFYLNDSPEADGDDMAIVDFQIMGQGSGAYDLAYFASQSIAPDVRRGRDAELIQAYVDALAAAGVQRDIDEVTRQYRIGLAHCLIYSVASYQSYDVLPENSQRLMDTMLARSIASITDMDSLSLIPD